MNTMAFPSARKTSTLVALDSNTRFTMSAPPPTLMPRRQSCDRCHNQKVRCFTDGPEEIFTPGGTADDEVNLNGHFVSSFPCRRCKKAASLCIFSRTCITRLSHILPLADGPHRTAQLRSGRPRLTRNSSSHLGCRKRASASTIPPSSRPPPLSPARSISTSPLPSSTPFVGFLGFGNTGHHGSIPKPQQQQEVVVVLNAPTQLDGVRLPNGMMTPVSHLSTEDQGNLGSLGPWLASPFNAGDMSISSYPSTPYFPASSIMAARGPMDYDPSLFTCTPGNASSGSLAPADFPWDYQSLEHEDYFQELAGIHKRAHHVGRTVLPVTTSLSTTPTDEAFEVGWSLVNLTDRYTAWRRSGHTSFSSMHRTVGDGMETSFCLMVMGCHQIILALFQEIVTSYVDALQLPRPSSSSSGTPIFVAASTTEEIDAMVKLASHLLGQLDQSLAGLFSLSPIMAPSQMIGSPRSPTDSDLSGEVEDFTDLLGQCGTTATVFRQVDRRKRRVQSLMHAARRCLVEHIAVT